MSLPSETEGLPADRATTSAVTSRPAGEHTGVRTRARVLYISYDGLLEPLGQSQVLQYLKALSTAHQIVLVTYEKGEDLNDEARVAAMRRETRAAGIRWVPLRYHKRWSVLATSFDLIVGFALCTYLALRHRLRIVHARAYTPAVIALGLKHLLRMRFIFDMRAFWADEKVDIGDWSVGSRIWRVAKWFERRFLTEADTVVSLTRAAVGAMREFPYLRERVPRFEVITTCTNLDYFRPAPRQKERSKSSQGRSRQDGAFTLGYVGSVRGSYLFAPVLECFRQLQLVRPNARLLVINRGSHDFIVNSAREHGIPRDALVVESASYEDVPRRMREMDAAAFFLKPGFSKLASVPTKLGELLACGVPCLTNGRAGDVRPLLETTGVGIILETFTPDAVAEAVRRLVALAEEGDIADRCVDVARQHFSLHLGVEAYDRIYRSLT